MIFWQNSFMRLSYSNWISEVMIDFLEKSYSQWESNMGNLDALGFSAKHFDGFKMLYIYCFIDMLIIIYLLWEGELK